MALVAAVGICLGVCVIGGRWLAHRRRALYLASYHARYEKEFGDSESTARQYVAFVETAKVATRGEWDDMERSILGLPLVHLGFARPDPAGPPPSDAWRASAAATWHQAADGYNKNILYHFLLKRKYERAAARPWESVAPDPAPPVPGMGVPPP
jgi:hypothetical protein